MGDLKQDVKHEDNTMPPSKKQKRLHNAAVANQGWMKKHEIETQINKDLEADENKQIVNSILHEDDEGGVQNTTGQYMKISQNLIKTAMNSTNVMKMAETIKFGIPGKRASMGPYKAYVARNGAHLLVTGRAGHMKLLDLMREKEVKETKFIRQKAEYKDLWNDNMCINQTIRDACFLSSHEMTAVATKSAVHIYSGSGHDMHRLAALGTVNRMAYLPYHFLLNCIDIGGNLTYTDMGANGGEIISKKHKAINGHANALRINPQTAVTAVATSKGVVQMFTPNDEKAVVELFCQHGGVRDLAFSIDGRQFVTTSDQGHIKVWDGRKTFEPISSYKVGAGRSTYVSISQNDHIAVGGGNNVMVWEKTMLKGSNGAAKAPMLTHQFSRGNNVHSLCFRPFYDILYCGSDNGVNPLIVPGSGIATVDTTTDLNPYLNTKARRNLLVKNLIEKLAPETICLDPDALGSYNPDAELNSSSEDSSDPYDSEGSYESEDESGDQDESDAEEKSN